MRVMEVLFFLNIGVYFYERFQRTLDQEKTVSIFACFFILTFLWLMNFAGSVKYDNENKN